MPDGSTQTVQQQQRRPLTLTHTMQIYHWGGYAIRAQKAWLTTPSGFARLRPCMMMFSSRKNLAAAALLTLLAMGGCVTDPASTSFAPSAPNSAAAEFLIVPNYGGGTVTVRRVDRSTGSTTELSGSPLAVTGSPKMVAVTPDRRFVYVTTQSDGIYAFAVNSASGVLTNVPGSPFTQVPNTFSAAVHPNGQFLICAGGTSVTSFTIHSDGTLSAVPGGSAQVSSQAGFAFNPPALARGGQFLYVPGGDNGIYGFAVDGSSGHLTPLSLGSYGSVKALAVHPSGDVVCAPANDNSLISQRVAADGSLSPLSTTPISFAPIGVTFSRAGRIYVGSQGSSGLFGFAVSASDGTFSALNGGAGYPGGSQETNFPAVDPYDRLLFVSARATSQVFCFVIDANGNLTAAPGSPASGFNLPDVPALVSAGP